MSLMKRNMSDTDPANNSSTKRRTSWHHTAYSTAFSFVILMGIVSLFSDMTHEGAAGIIGAYLSLAGASAATIGFVSGLGELIGYSLRIATGWWADRTHHYWGMVIVGYCIDCAAIPALALISPDGWIWACVLIVVQRMGKAIKKPSKDTIISFAATQSGVGKSFAVQEFLDQLGAVLGPVLLFVIMSVQQGQDMFDTYRLCFAILGLPALATIVSLLIARHRFPHPERFEAPTRDNHRLHSSGTFICYIAAISLFACGFIDFPLITMHISNQGIVPSSFLPLIYAFAMGVDGIAALIFGWLYDRHGMGILTVSTVISSVFAPFIFCGGTIATTIIGVALWGVGMGAQESIMKAAVTDLVPAKSRSTGFGVFQVFFGIFWFLGSWATGALYDVNIWGMVAFSVIAQWASLPLFYHLSSMRRTSTTEQR
jgi:MFS family permease